MNLEETLAEALEEEKLTGKKALVSSEGQERNKKRQLSLHIAWERELWEIWGQLFKAIFTKVFMNMNVNF